MKEEDMDELAVKLDRLGSQFVCPLDDVLAYADYIGMVRVRRMHPSPPPPAPKQAKPNQNKLKQNRRSQKLIKSSQNRSEAVLGPDF